MTCDIISTNNLNVPAMLVTSGNVVKPVWRSDMDSVSYKRCGRCGEIKPALMFCKDSRSKSGLRSDCKECQKIYRNENKDSLSFVKRLWALAHLEHKKECDKRWNKENAERAKQNKINWKEANKEKTRDIKKKWKKNNREKENESARQRYHLFHDIFLSKKRNWLINNPDKITEYNQKRRSRKNENGGSVSAEEWGKLKEKYNYTCLCCGRKEPEIKLTQDHVVPLSKGGKNTIDNSQPLCKSCNCKKGVKTIDYRGGGRIFK